MSGAKGIPDVDEIGDTVVTEATKFFCRHLVAIVGTYFVLDDHGKPSGKMRVFVYSGFVMEIFGKWYVATAGHALKEFERDVKQIRICECSLIDTFGNATSPYSIPFSLIGADKFFVHDDEVGLDYGFVALDSNIERLLRVNNIVPVDRQNFINLKPENMDLHMLIGLPECFQEEEPIADGRMAFDLSVAMIHVVRIDDLSADLETTARPRFVGQLDDRVSFDIKGMSGGPIIGINRSTGRYWVVAIQSSWKAKGKIIFGCPMNTFISLFEAEAGKEEPEE